MTVGVGWTLASTFDLAHALFGPAGDGRWRVVVFEGEHVANMGLTATVRWGEVAQAGDGCFYGARQGDGSHPAPMAVCVDHGPAPRRWLAFARAEPSVALLADGRLRLAKEGRVAILVPAPEGVRQLGSRGGR